MQILLGLRRMKVARAESGLTTLEWLLIVAAVAGLAALAVVLVQNVVDDTAEEISGNNARITAAKVAADQINSDAAAEILRTATGLTIPESRFKAINSEFESKCNRLKITYSDADVQVSDWADFVGAATSGTVTVVKATIEAHKACELEN